MTIHTAIITGGNRGLGFECARAMAKMPDWRLIIACREPQKAQAEILALREQSHNPLIDTLPLDLASLDSINDFARQIHASPLLPITALICNAGIQIVSGTQTTRDGFEMTFGVNHLGHYLLVNRLLDCLDQPARVLFVSSGTHDPAQKTGMPEPDFSQPRQLAYPPAVETEDPGRAGRRRYTTSKLANVYTTYELARRLKDQGNDSITVNVFDPGLMPGTGLARDYTPLARFGWKFILPLLALFQPGVNRVEVSGADLAYLATAPGLAGTTGSYFVRRKITPSSKESYDLAKAKELWEISAALVGLDQTI